MGSQIISFSGRWAEIDFSVADGGTFCLFVACFSRALVFSCCLSPSLFHVSIPPMSDVSLTLCFVLRFSFPSPFCFSSSCASQASFLRSLVRLQTCLPSSAMSVLDPILVCTLTHDLHTCSDSCYTYLCSRLKNYMICAKAHHVT